MNVKELKAQLDLLPDDFEVYASVAVMGDAIPVSMPMLVLPALKQVFFG